MSEPTAPAGDAGESPPDQQAVEQTPPPAAGNAAGGQAGGDEEGAVGKDDSIEKEIERLKKEAQEARDAKDTADITFADKDNRLSTLRTVQRDLDANQQSYAKAYDQLKRDEQVYRDYLNSEKESLEQLLKGLADEVRNKDAALKSDRQALEQQVTEKTKALQEAEAKRDASQADVKDKTERVSQYKKLAATITSRLATLKSRRDEITKADQAGQYAVAYWLLVCRDYSNVLGGEPNLIKPDELPQRLITALDALATAESQLKKDERAVSKCRDDLAAAKTARDDHVANAEKNLRAQLEQMQPPAPPTGGKPDNA